MSSCDYSSNDSSDNYPIIHNTYDKAEEGELESLIEMLQIKIENEDPQIKCIKYPNMLISSLIELNHLVGMERLKDSIALQVMRLVDGVNNGEKSSRMLNTILYGPPGVGKTKVGIILAKIWCSLGYLKKPANIKIPQQPNGTAAGGIPGTYTNTTIVDNNGINPLVWIILLFMFYAFTYIVTGAKYIYNQFGLMWLGILFAVAILIIFIIYWNSETYVTQTSQTYQNEKESLKEKNPDEISDRDIITVVSRQDFVAEYVGQTATKTKALLYANMGKVVFIDEAYSLINGDRDPFGMEALTTLNLFMSEHPDSIAIIFAGYKNIMKHGIFRIQPGLPRRCMWHFECEGYDGDQLCDIFLRQTYKEGWAIRKTDYEPIRRLICENEHMFKAYGGDTERLLFFSQLEASRNNMMNGSHSYSHSYNQSDMSDMSHMNAREYGEYSGKIITHDHVQQGLIRLEENNIETS